MSEYRKYKTVHTADPAILDRTVTHLIQHGEWQPYGDPFVHQATQQYCQALVSRVGMENEEDELRIPREE